MKSWLRYYLFESSFRFQMAKWIDSVKRRRRKKVELFLTVRASVRISQFSPSYQLRPPSPGPISHPFVNFRLTEWGFTYTVPVTHQAAILWSYSEWLTLGNIHHALTVMTQWLALLLLIREAQSLNLTQSLLFLIYWVNILKQWAPTPTAFASHNL
jgi:hypothetical protein